MEPALHLRDPKDMERQAQKFRQQAEEFANEENEKMKPLSKDWQRDIDEFRRKFPKVYAAVEKHVLIEDRAQKAAAEARFQAETKKTADARVAADKAAASRVTAVSATATKVDPEAQWEADAALRAEFLDDKDRFMAYAKAVENKQVRLIGKK